MSASDSPASPLSLTRRQLKALLLSRLYRGLIEREKPETSDSAPAKDVSDLRKLMLRLQMAGSVMPQDDPRLRFDLHPWRNDKGQLNWENFSEYLQRRGGQITGNALASRAESKLDDIISAENKLRERQDYLKKYWGIADEEKLRDAVTLPGMHIERFRARQVETSIFHELYVIQNSDKGTFEARLLSFPDEKKIGIETVDAKPAGQGALKQFMAAVLKLADHVGADRIELVAGREQGAIVWPRTGIYAVDETINTRDSHGHPCVYSLGWRDLCADVRDKIDRVRKGSAFSDEELQILKKAEALVQEGAPKSNLYKLAHLEGPIRETSVAKFLLGPQFSGYFNLKDPEQTGLLRDFIARSPKQEPAPARPGPIPQQNAVPNTDSRLQL